ncbi:MAG: hypothetical protein JOZ72_05355 [Alphaproteobacteria bacterium]|nr:hypothetical protein [Alphaproteobacteria bacterium]
MKRAPVSGSVFATTIFLSSAQASDYQVLHSFDGSDGASPNGNLVLDQAGNLYGATFGGGESGLGTIFKLSTAGEYSVVHSFTGGVDGGDPSAGLAIDPSTGDFYGTTTTGGSLGRGGIFRLTAAGQLTVLHDFNRDTDGIAPSAQLTPDGSGNFYGTTYQEGPTGGGTVFELASTGSFKVLHAFRGREGGEPAGRLERHGASLFGVNFIGGSGSGTIFKTKLDGTTTVLCTPNQGVGFAGGPARDDSGNLYGASFWGQGTIYALSRKGTLSTLYAFTGGADGHVPVGELVLTNHGKLYGAANRGGIDDNGTLFKLDLQGNFTLLHSFTGDDGRLPMGGLTKGSDGKLYGTTSMGGSHDQGVIFSVAAR